MEFNLKRIISTLFISLIIHQAAIAQVVNFSLTKQNIVFVDVDNPIKIAVEGISCDKLFPITNNGVIQGKDCSYTINPSKMGMCRIKVCSLSKNDTLVHEEIILRAKNVPNPVAMIGNFHEGDISVDELKKERGINLIINDFDFDYRFILRQYTVRIFRDGKEIYVEKANSYAFSNETKKIFETLKPCDKIVVDKIITNSESAKIGRIFLVIK